MWGGGVFPRGHGYLAGQTHPAWGPLCKVGIIRWDCITAGIQQPAVGKDSLRELVRGLGRSENRGGQAGGAMVASGGARPTELVPGTQRQNGQEKPGVQKRPGGALTWHLAHSTVLFVITGASKAAEPLTLLFPHPHVRKTGKMTLFHLLFTLSED